MTIVEIHGYVQFPERTNTEGLEGEYYLRISYTYIYTYIIITTTHNLLN